MARPRGSHRRQSRRGRQVAARSIYRKNATEPARFTSEGIKWNFLRSLFIPSEVIQEPKDNPCLQRMPQWLAPDARIHEQRNKWKMPWVRKAQCQLLRVTLLSPAAC